MTTFGVKDVGLVHVPDDVKTCTSAALTSFETFWMPPAVY
jgi:hypothetical protein